MLRVHRQCRREYLEPEYVYNFCQVAGPILIVHLGKNLAIQKCLKQNTHPLIVLIVLYRPRLIIQAHVEFWEGIILEDLSWLQTFLWRLHSHLFFCFGRLQKQLISLIPGYLQYTILSILQKFSLLIKEDDLSILITFPEAPGFYEIRKKCSLGHFVQETLWVLRIIHFQEGFCVEEVTRVKKHIFCGIWSVLYLEKCK